MNITTTSKYIHGIKVSGLEKIRKEIAGKRYVST